MMTVTIFTFLGNWEFGLMAELQRSEGCDQKNKEVWGPVLKAPSGVRGAFGHKTI